jgi:hypothetical protein
MYLIMTASSAYFTSQWPRGLRHRFAAARLLRLWVRMSPGVWKNLFVVSVLCCKVDVSATNLSLVQRNPTDCGASLSVMYKPREYEGPGPLGGPVAPKTNKQMLILSQISLICLRLL